MKKKPHQIKKGEIHLIPFPFTDLSSSKLRPCVVVGSDKEDIIVVFVTSIKPKDTMCIEIIPSKENGIKVFSYIRFTKIATLDKKMSLGTIGVLSESVHKEMLKKISEFLAK